MLPRSARSGPPRAILGRRATALASPSIRDDAEGAVVIAALDDHDVGLEAGPAADLAELVDGVLLGQLEHHRLAALGPGRRHELPDLLHLPGPGHEVDPRGALQDLGTGDLGDATGDTDHEVRVFLPPASEDPERAEDLVLGLLAHRAGVEDSDFRRAGFGALARTLEPERLELAAHALAVEDVHLAAPGLDEDGPAIPLRRPDRVRVAGCPSAQPSGERPALPRLLRARQGPFARLRPRSRGAASFSFAWSQAGRMTRSR